MTYWQIFAIGYDSDGMMKYSSVDFCLASFFFFERSGGALYTLRAITHARLVTAEEHVELAHTHTHTHTLSEQSQQQSTELTA